MYAIHPHILHTPLQGLHLSAIPHVTSIDINENGTAESDGTVQVNPIRVLLVLGIKVHALGVEVFILGI